MALEREVTVMVTLRDRKTTTEVDELMLTTAARVLLQGLRKGTDK